MNNTELLTKIYSGKLIARNTIYNLLGYGLPLIVAVFVIPFLINGLGDEKFGILNLIWILIGYFSFFDFGIGKTLTKIIAEKIGGNKTEEIPGIFWTSIFLMTFISVVGTIILILIIPFLVNSFFNISEGLKTETRNAFLTLAVFIPVVTTTAGLRGVLEAYQEFRKINFLRIILGVFTFLIPLICLVFTSNLVWIVISLSFIRIIIWILYLFYCFKINNKIKNEINFYFSLIKPILKISGWITVANLLAPLIIYSDRILIGGLISAAAITYYATPFEVITKLLLIPGALVGVLFPVFSASYASDPEFSKKIFIKGIKFIFLIIYPIILFIVTFSYEGMELWLGENFAEKSSLILQLFSIGVLLNSLANIPFHFFQGIGKPDIPAKINLIELPVYIFFMWIIIIKLGIIGAAIVWLVRIVIDSFVLLFFANKTVEILFKSRILTVIILASMVILFIPLLMDDFLLKIFFFIIIFSVFLFITWKYLLSSEEKVFLISKIRIISI